jgi:hypothetical protein
MAAHNNAAGNDPFVYLTKSKAATEGIRKASIKISISTNKPVNIRQQ